VNRKANICGTTNTEQGLKPDRLLRLCGTAKQAAEECRKYIPQGLKPTMILYRFRHD
jgi:hypothetical protein